MRINAPAYSSDPPETAPARGRPAGATVRPSGGEGVQVRGGSGHNTPASGFLGGVQCSISRSQQGGKVRLVERIFGDSAAEADADSGFAADRAELVQQRVEP